MKKYTALILLFILIFNAIPLNISASESSAELSGVTVSNGTLVPGFLPDVYNYTIGIEAGDEIPDITYVKAADSAVVNMVKAEGLNQTTTITVTNGSDEKVYSFEIKERNENGEPGKLIIKDENAFALISNYNTGDADKKTKENLPANNRPRLFLHKTNKSKFNFVIIKFDFTNVKYDIYGNFSLELYDAAPLENNNDFPINIYAVNASADWSASQVTYNNSFGNSSMTADMTCVTQVFKGADGAKKYDVTEVIRNRLLKGEKIITLAIEIDKAYDMSSFAANSVMASYYSPYDSPNNTTFWPTISFDTVVLSKDNTLKEVTVKDGILDRMFDPQVTEYKVGVPEGKTPVIDYKLSTSHSSAVYTPAGQINETASIVVIPQDPSVMPKEYTFRFVSLADAGITSDGIVTVDSVSFSCGNSLPSDGTITFRANVKNGNINKKSVIMLTALKKNGMLDSILSIEKYELESGYNFVESENISLPADVSGLTAEGYLFDADTQLPLFDKAEAPEASSENTVFSAAQKLQYSINGSKVIFFGRVVPNTNIPFVLIAPDKNINHFTKNDHSAVIALDMIRSGADGLWEYQTEVPYSNKFYTAYISENGALESIPVLHTSVEDKLSILRTVYNAVYDNSEEAALSALKAELGLKNASNINELILGLDTSEISGLDEDNLINLIYNFVKNTYETKPVVSGASDVNAFIGLYNSALIIAKLNAGSIVVIPELISKLGFNDLTVIYNMLIPAEIASIEGKLIRKGFVSENELYNEIKTLMLLSVINNAENTSITEDTVGTYGSFLGLDMTGYGNLEKYQSDIISELANMGPYETRELISKAFGGLITKYSNPPYTVINPPSPGVGGGGGGGGGFKVPATGIEDEFDVPTEELVPPPVKVFNDIEIDNWAYEPTKYLADRGIISGVGNGSFAPSNPVKREEFAKILCLAFELEETDAEAEFSDVDKSAWYYPYVKTAFANSAMQGTDKNLFGTGKGLLRQDIAVIIARILELSEQDSQAFNDDLQISDYAKASVYALKKLGVISGTGEGNFEPKRTVTRAECAKIVYEIVKEMK